MNIVYNALAFSALIIYGIQGSLDRINLEHLESFQSVYYLVLLKLHFILLINFIMSV
jgi:hypothetical protein